MVDVVVDGRDFGDEGPGKANRFSGVLDKLKSIKIPEFVRRFSFTKEGMSFQDAAKIFATFEERSGVSVLDVVPTSIRHEQKSDQRSQVHYVHYLEGGEDENGTINFDNVEQGEAFAQALRGGLSTPGALAGYSHIMELKDKVVSWENFVGFLKGAWTNQSYAQDLVQSNGAAPDIRSGSVYDSDDELVDELAGMLDDEDLDDLDWDALLDDLDGDQPVVEKTVEQETPDNTSKVTHEEIEALLAPDQADDLDVPYFARKGPLAFFKEEEDFQTARGILDKLAQEQPDLNMAQAYLTDDYKALSFPGDAQDYPIDLQGLSGRVFEKVLFAVQETLEVLRAGKSVGDRDPYEGLSEGEIASVSGVSAHVSVDAKPFLEADKEEPSVSESNYEMRKQWAQMLRGYADKKHNAGLDSASDFNHASLAAADVLKVVDLEYEDLKSVEAKNGDLVLTLQDEREFNVMSRDYEALGLSDMVGSSEQIAQVMNKNICRAYAGLDPEAYDMS